MLFPVIIVYLWFFNRRQKAFNKKQKLNDEELRLYEKYISMQNPDIDHKWPPDGLSKREKQIWNYATDEFYFLRHKAEHNFGLISGAIVLILLTIYLFTI